MKAADGRVRTSLTNQDIATLERAVKRYQLLGLEASIGVTSQGEGRATIWHVDPRDRIASTFQLEIEKYAADFGQRFWVIKISRSDGSSMTMRGLGQVSSKILLFALANAERLIERGDSAPRWDAIPRDQIGRSEIEALDKLAATLSAPDADADTVSLQRLATRRGNATQNADDFAGVVAALEKSLLADRPDLQA